MFKLKYNSLKLMRKIIVILTFIVAISSMYFAPSYVSALSNIRPNTSYGTPDILVPPVQGPSVSQRLSNRAATSWPWYLTRAAGLTAAVSLVLLILSGVGFITGYTFRLLEPLTAWATHKALAIVFSISVVVHGVALLFDKYVPFKVSQVLIPFRSTYRPVTLYGHKLGSLYVALGILASYLLLIIILTSYLWIDKKPHTWKAFHLLAYLIMILVFVHALFVGTDLAHGLLRILWIVFGVITGLAILYRLGRSRRI